VSRRQAMTAVLTGAMLLLGAGAAAAGTTAPERVTAHGEVPLSGVIEERDRTGVAELRVSGPGVAPVAVARSAQPSPETPRSDPAQVAFALTTAPCNVPGETCGGGRALPNGTWTVQLFEVERLREDDVERGEPVTFVVDVPAGTPQDVVAAIDERTVTVQWARGVGADKAVIEPDVRWTVDDGKGRTATVSPAVCQQGTCRVQLPYPDDASGPRRFTVAGQRPGTSPAAASAPSNEVVVPVVPGAPSPGASPAATPGASPGADGAGPGQATAQSFDQGFSSFPPSLGLPQLPQQPGSSPSVAVPQVADTFEPTLGYDVSREAESVTREPVAAPQGREGVLTSDGGLLGDAQLLRSVAGALVLLLAGGHLRTWLARSRPGEL
jgi:hypothetical protein